MCIIWVITGSVCNSLDNLGFADTDWREAIHAGCIRKDTSVCASEPLENLIQCQTKIEFLLVIQFVSGHVSFFI